MTEQEILYCIYSDLSNIACRSGCSECCSGALWSSIEWKKLPDEFKDGIGAVKVPMLTFNNERKEALLPVRLEMVMPMSYKKKMAAVANIDSGLFLTAVGLDGTICPFISEDGCSIYDYRPFICRVMGATSCLSRLVCPEGIKPDRDLPDHQITQRFRMWVSLLESKESKIPQEVTNQCQLAM